ncbi:hypothetical protein ABK040_004482 [Willaertia magna]
MIVETFIYCTLFFITTISVAILVNYIKYLQQCNKYKNIPGSEQYIPADFLEFIPSFLIPKTWIRSIPLAFNVENLLARSKQYNGVFKSTFGLANITCVAISDPNFAKELAGKAHKHFSKEQRFDIVFSDLFNGSNVFSSVDYNNWLRQRHAVEPGFTPETLQYVSNVVNDAMIKQLIAIIQKSPTKRDVMTDFGNSALDVVGKACFGYDFNCLESDLEGKTCAKVQNFLTNANLFSSLPTKFLRQNLKAGPLKSIHECVAEFTKVIGDILEKRKAEREQDVDDNDVLSLLLRAREENLASGNGSDKNAASEITDEELISNIFILLVAGHDTTARALGFALYLLAKHPEIQEKCFDQLTHVDSLDYDSYKSGRLNLIRGVFKETLRLYPPAIGIIREVIKPYTWKPRYGDNDVKIEKGDLCLFSWVHSHRNPLYWKDPESFIPERFLKGDNNDTIVNNPTGHPFAYTPFGLGTRTCIGKHFAEVEAVITLAHLIKNFRIKLSDPNYEMQTECQITIRPLNTLLIDFIPRE